MSVKPLFCILEWNHQVFSKQPDTVQDKKIQFILKHGQHANSLLFSKVKCQTSATVAAKRYVQRLPKK